MVIQKGQNDVFFYDPIDRKTFVSTHATFLEDDYVKSHKPRSTIILEETVRPTPKTNVQGNPSPPTIVVRVGDEEENTNVGPSATLPRRSGRVSREPDRYLGFEANVVALDANDDDPVSFNDAMVDLDKEKWLEAMDLEIESMHSNSVWTLVDAPEQIIPIGCKWIYKRKK